MFRVTSDESVIDANGRIIFFGLQRFIADIANGDTCFICGASRDETEFNDEHVIPDWILRRSNLHSRYIQIPNQTGYRYGQLKVPCCSTCNTAMGVEFEEPISAMFAGGYDSVCAELSENGPLRLFQWLSLMFLKTHLKDKYLNYHRDRRKGEMKIAEFHSWDDLHHIHCVARSFFSGCDLDQRVLGSIFVIPAKVRPHYDDFDFIDLSRAQTMLLSIGETAIVAVLNDSQAVAQMAVDDLTQKIGGPLSPIQLREVAAIFASINLQLQPRPRFCSEIDIFNETCRIVADCPEQIGIEKWNDDLHGAIMHALTQEFLNKDIRGKQLLQSVRSGKYTFLTNPEGEFDLSSMELVPDIDTQKSDKGEAPMSGEDSVGSGDHEQVDRGEKDNVE